VDSRRWAQIEELFHRASECDPTQRARLLEESGDSDPELRRMVEALLASAKAAAENLQAAIYSGLDAVAFPLVGEEISHYRILAGIGTGGMGSVYRAEDVKLRRQVALKFLAQEFTQDSAALSRFEREARSASALDHRGICPIYEFGEHGGQPFLVMPLLQGQTLRELLAGRAPGPLGISELLDLAVQIAEALDAAHRHGIVHRDIKPANIFVTTQGEVKILDFGLAKSESAEIGGDESPGAARAVVKEDGGSSRRVLSTPEVLLSRAGVAFGTSAYMSPEQAHGEKLDARTDIFSFGLVLYEMATGRRAFQEATEPILHDVIFRQSSAPVRQINPALPAKLEAVIERALERNRDARYPTAGELRADLAAVRAATSGRRARHRAQLVAAGLAVVVLATSAVLWVAWRSAPPPTSPNVERTSSGAAAAIHSVAVLPLENLSGDKEQEYFADGMTDALTTDLARIGSLRVISRTSAMQFKGSKETLPQIGRDLKVDAVVEGAVTRGENRVRVTAQLVEVSSDRHLWASTYERDLKDVLALQDAIAQDIAEQIRVKLTPKERSLLIQVHAVDPEAHDAYLRGRYWAYKGTSEGGRKALEYYQKAIAKDPSYAPTYAGVADAFLILTSWANPSLTTSGDLSRQEASSKVKEAAIKALALDPSLAEPYSSMAFIKLFNDWDWAGGEAELKQSIALNPNFAEAHYRYSIYLVAMERLDEAVNECERARDLDPFDYAVNEWLGQALYHARRYDDALRQLRRTLEMFPDRRREKLYHEIAEVYEQKRMFAEAFAARQQALSVYMDDPNLAPDITALGEAYKRSGYRGWMLKAVQIMEQGPPNVYNFSNLAHMYAMLDDEAHAMSYLERLYEEHSVTTLFIRTAPELDSIRSSPRFRELVRRIGFPQPSSNKN
jgi:serine/threonine protein kinase